VFSGSLLPIYLPTALGRLRRTITVRVDIGGRRGHIGDNTPATPLNDAQQAGFFMSRIPFQKPVLTVPQQLALLQQRGMTIPDQSRAEHYLRFIGYYRLSGYWFNFQHRDGTGAHDQFKPGTDFETHTRSVCV